MSDQNQKVLPCPFCGAPANDFNPDGEEEGYSITCSGKGSLFGADKSCCPICSFSFSTYGEAVSAWNRRAPAPSSTAGDVLPALRMLTKDEVLACKHHWHSHAIDHEAIQRKFCEVNGLAIGAVPARSAWQPISTAPKHGRDLILLLTPSGFPQVAYSDTWWTAGFSVECKPTHWMPLPAVPTDAAQRAEPGQPTGSAG